MRADLGQGFDAVTLWQVKASTLCNLRCRYCYEWDRLADARRMPLPLWRRTLAAMRDYRAARQAATGLNAIIMVTWHGGEPLALPADYVRDALALQAEVFGTDAAAVHNAAQTNLFKPNATLETMIEAGFDFNVSFDGAGGVAPVRLDGAGRDSAAAVRRNIRMLTDRGVPFGVTVVLGRHNAAALPDVHDDVAALGADWLRINPMFAPPPTAPAERLALSVDEIVAAYARLIDHRVRTGATLAVSPLNRAAETLRRLREGGDAGDADRATVGETRLVVHPDGILATQPGPQLPDSVLGDLKTQTMADILASDAYRSSIAADRDRRAAHCGRCAYVDGCSGMPLIEAPLSAESGPCPIEPRLCALLAAGTVQPAAVSVR